MPAHDPGIDRAQAQGLAFRSRPTFLYKETVLQKDTPERGWRDGTVVKSIGYSSGGPLAHIPRDRTPSLASEGSACMWCTGIHAGKHSYT